MSEDYSTERRRLQIALNALNKLMEDAGPVEHRALSRSARLVRGRMEEIGKEEE